MSVEVVLAVAFLSLFVAILVIVITLAIQETVKNWVVSIALALFALACVGTFGTGLAMLVHA